jgi:predicted acyltransferase (DUF342 family)
MSFSKKLFNILAVPTVAVLFSIVFAKPANAAEFHFADYTLSKDQTVNTNVYVLNSNSEIDGVVQGDLIVIAQDVNISGVVTGDIYAIGSNVTFTGTAYGNFFAVGENENIKGTITGNLYTVGSTVNFNGQLGKDLLDISSQGNISGTVTDDLRVVAKNANIDATIKGEVVVLASQYNISKDKVLGNIYDTAAIKEIAKEQGVNFGKEKSTSSNSFSSWSGTIFVALFSYVSLGLVGYFMIMLTPVKTGKILTKITGSPKDFVLSFLIGAAILLVAPIAFILLSLSLVGIPLALLVFGILLFLTIFGRLWVEIGLGQELLTIFKVKDYRPFKSLALGRLLSVLIGLIPFVGMIYTLVLMATSVGAFVRMKKEYWDIGRTNK